MESWHRGSRGVSGVHTSPCPTLIWCWLQSLFRPRTWQGGDLARHLPSLPLRLLPLSAPQFPHLRREGESTLPQKIVSGIK